MRRVIFAWVAAVAVIGTARAQACAYSAYRPGMVLRILQSTLYDAGVGILPYGTEETRLPAGGSYLLRASQVWGGLRYNEDVRSGTSALMVTDAEGATIALATERIGICPGPIAGTGPMGRCKLTEITTELDQLSTQPPPFSIVLDPTGREHLLRYGKYLVPHQWRGQLGETLRWLQAVITHPRTTRALVARNAQESIRFSLASDPRVAPYLDRLTYFFDGTYWVVMGRVPSDFVYGRVIDRIRAAGYPYVRPEMTIDTGSGLPLPLPPRAEACYHE